MRVLHIHKAGMKEGPGGAICMRRLHFGLRDAGVDSKILCVREIPHAKNDHVVISKPSKIELIWNINTKRITNPLGLEDILNINSLRIMDNKSYQDANIINFHRVFDIFSYLAFPRLTKDKPAVFTLHEMWPFTGHCRYSYECERWKSGCGKCPFKSIYTPPIRFDYTWLQWKIKKWIYKRSNITFIAPSRWIYRLSQKSVLNSCPIHYIPHGINTNIFRKLDPFACRAKLGLPKNKKIILFVAHQIKKFVKGGDLLLKSLNKLPQKLKDESILLTMGLPDEKIPRETDMQTVSLGYISDDSEKATVYNAADLFICPSRAETLGLVLLESMACGTPAVAFDVGGISDTVLPGRTGYLAKPENTEELTSGIIVYLENDKIRKDASKKCREIILKKYTIELMVKRYSELYRQVIAKNNY